ncbi:site-specific integrase, partial [Thermus sp.]
MGRKRRAKGEGTLYLRPDGRWEGKLTVGGRRITVYGQTQEEALRKLTDLAAKNLQGLLRPPEAITLREWAEGWLGRKGKEVRPRTLYLYRQELAYALPSLKDPTLPDPLGGMRLQAIQPAHVRQILDGLMGRLSLRTVRMVRQRLWQVFEEALNLELVARNPVAPVKVRGPKAPKAGRTLEPSELQVLLQALDRHPDPRTAMALRLCLACGLRKGEVLALRWADVDLERGTLSVTKAWAESGGQRYLTLPKTASSERRVPIPQATLNRLREYREWWKGAFGFPDPWAWVFPGRKGEEPLNPHTLNWALRR